MLKVMADTGMTAREWAIKADVAGTTITRAIKPEYKFVTSSRSLAKLGAAIGVAPPDVAKTGDPRIVPHFLPVRYVVQAGEWRRVDDATQEFYGTYPVSPDPRFAEWPQWLELIMGDSINLKAAEGGYAHVVDAIDMGYAPQDGHFVVVERRIDGGHRRERTVKQIVINKGVVELWPRSTNPEWKGPVLLTRGAEHQDIEVEIVGLVLGFYQPTLV